MRRKQMQLRRGENRRCEIDHLRCGGIGNTSNACAGLARDDDGMVEQMTLCCVRTTAFHRRAVLPLGQHLAHRSRTNVRLPFAQPKPTSTSTTTPIQPIWRHLAPPPPQPSNHRPPPRALLCPPTPALNPPCPHKTKLPVFVASVYGSPHPEARSSSIPSDATRLVNHRKYVRRESVSITTMVRDEHIVTPVIVKWLAIGEVAPSQQLLPSHQTTETYTIPRHMLPCPLHAKTPCPFRLLPPPPLSLVSPSHLLKAT